MTAPQVAGCLPDGWVLIEEYKPAFVARPLKWETPFPPLLNVQVLGVEVTAEEWPRWARDRLDEVQEELGGCGEAGRAVEGEEAWLATSRGDLADEVIVVQRYRHLPSGDVLLAAGRALQRDWPKIAGPLRVSLASFFAGTPSAVLPVDIANERGANWGHNNNSTGSTVEG